ncbi:hypothetical protein DASC09_007300 [Saccharomycopsis crataegensis]|uniref:Uncharacterized protein n=1 Tax=Saccharomycopsis crataegensis TaxID=43959 RepID=A0AAV5QG27_9ASCO|nr:hypothetical protein DASC09_007300 [Saccharomycopsis crataegensis]
MWKLVVPRTPSQTIGIRYLSTCAKRLSQYPPTYFSNPSPAPKNMVGSSPLIPSNPASPSHITYSPASNMPTQRKLGFGKDVALCMAVFVLTYFAIDNYISRQALQTESFKNSMEHQKALTLAQLSFNNARKKREIQILNERKNFQKREMKMALHIALLRKQLEATGVKPVNINEAINEFEKNVKMENSLSNITGTSLWVVDDADIKSHLPSTHEYDKK